MQTHPLATRLEGLKARLGIVRKDTRGMAAVEFAMIVPIMFFLFVGTIEFSQALTVDRRVTQAASATADLIARAPKDGLTPLQVDRDLKIIEQLIAPYELSRLTVRIVQVRANGINGQPPSSYSVSWSRDNSGGTPYPRGSSYTAIPPGLLTTGEFVIVGEATYNYTPLLFHYFIQSAFNLSEKFYLKPRNSSCVRLAGVETQCT